MKQLVPATQHRVVTRWPSASNCHQRSKAALPFLPSCPSLLQFQIQAAPSFLLLSSSWELHVSCDLELKPTILFLREQPEPVSKHCSYFLTVGLQDNVSGCQFAMSPRMHLNPRSSCLHLSTSSRIVLHVCPHCVFSAVLRCHRVNGWLDAK